MPLLDNIDNLQRYLYKNSKKYKLK